MSTKWDSVASAFQSEIDPSAPLLQQYGEAETEREDWLLRTWRQVHLAGWCMPPFPRFPTRTPMGKPMSGLIPLAATSRSTWFASWILQWFLIVWMGSTGGWANLAEAAVWPRRMGDLDGDGQATVIDLTRLLNHLNQTPLLSPVLAPFADVNNDGTVNEADVTALANAILAATTLPTLKDSDGDGLPDLVELALGLDPTKKDTDGNGIPDGAEDWDQDALANAQEIASGTDPRSSDTDQDGWSDEAEVTAGSNPNDPRSGPKLLFVARPPLVQMLPMMVVDRSSRGYGMTLAQPPVQVTLPSAAISSSVPMGMTLAYPPVQVTLPSAAISGSVPMGMTLAYPPVQVTLPSAAISGSVPMGMTLAQPPVAVALPSARIDGGLSNGVTLAYPPVQVVLPSAALAGEVSLGLSLARPPVKVKIDGP